jgi:hypothetical protein
MEVSVQLHSPAALHPGKDPVIHWIGLNLRANLDAVQKRKICFPSQDSLPDFLIIQPVA